MRLILLYQVGIANLFACDDQGDARIYQGDYRGAEMMARGALLADADIEVMHWYWCASLRYAFLISSALAVLPTPRMS
jgi:hypothetical protein